MYSSPKVFCASDLSHRSYVHFTYNKRRYRYSDGKALGIECNVASATTVTQRLQRLETLQMHIQKLLLSGWNPETLVDVNSNKLISDLQEKSIKKLIPIEVTDRHREDVLRHAAMFRDYLLENNIKLLATFDVTKDDIQPYLDTILSSTSYYMIVRNRLSCLFSYFIKAKMISINPVHHTATKKRVPQLNRAYDNDTFKLVLEYFKNNHSDLYLCSLLMYGCFLRPHEEVRNLKRNNFSPDLKVLSLDGFSNKSRKIRVIPVPKYVRELLLQREIHTLPNQQHLFTVRNKVCNEDYFSTAWKRIKKELLADNIIDQYHTLYSIRHTAAINVFNKTQDLAKLSQLMGHADVHVTTTYLRSLGILININEDDMPSLY